MQHQSRKKLNFKNPVIMAQVLESPFVPDPFLGHTMPSGQDFIGEKKYISFDEVIAEIKKTKKSVILNIGDSSTSGWDSNVVTQNRQRLANNLPLLPAFFHYKTYSDVLRDKIGDEFIIINAGVPAHTSIQGYRRLLQLLKQFKNENVIINCITAYYGNNDSVWDHNRQDKEWVGKKNNIFTFLLKKFKKSKSSIITRVSTEDYKKNLKGIIEICRLANIPIILIKPLTPLYWKPGTRVQGEDLERRNYPGSDVVYKLLDEALDLWHITINQKDYSELKKAAFEQVREKDFIVPRIKKSHLNAFHEVSAETAVPSINIDLDRSMDDIRYFIDYCHPIELANELIAMELQRVIENDFKPVKQYIKRESNSVINSQTLKLDIPTTHYTLY